MAKIINIKDHKKDERKIRAIEFMEKLIKELKEDKINPDKIIIFLKWKLTEERDYIKHYNNIETTTELLGCIKILEDRILEDTVRT